ncbi:hypothetical protein [Serratia quinivorans]|uniref:hypothetical protein n=1 Tax=Serratia quinivorans TaxID=137545 RepID=UPI00217A7666|nr:hypothetical protein [Serratia quinivorans]CAI1072474.1 Uncharacterised protein [Serratia quinivorans]
MNTASRIALIWGTVCFLLLYSTLPADVIIAWQVFRQYDPPASQLMVYWGTKLLPALVPLGCFLLLGHRVRNNKSLTLLLPFSVWLACQFIIAGFFYVVAVKSGSLPPYSEGLLSFVLRILNIEWLTNSLVSALIVVACSYAFWREQCFRLKGQP